MGAAETRVVRLVLREHFGRPVEAVGWALCRDGPLSASGVHARLSQTASCPLSARRGLPTAALSLRAVRESLVVLIHHNMVEATEDAAAGRPGRVVYVLDGAAVVQRLGLPLLVAAAAPAGSAAERLLLRVVREGRTLLSALEAEEAAAAQRLLADGVLEPVSPGAAARPPEDSPPPAKRHAHSKSGSGFAPLVRIAKRALSTHVFVAAAVEAARRRVNRGAAVLMHVALRDASRSSPLRVTVTELAREALEHGRTCASCGAAALAKSVDALLPVEWRGERTPEKDRTSARVLVEHYMERLALEFPFVRRDAATTSVLVRGEARMEAAFFVDVDGAREWLRGEAVLGLAAALQGAPAARLMRVASVLVDERTAGTRALMAPLAVRTALYSLLRAGLLALQDVPRTAERTAKSTYYLWAQPRPRARLWRTAASTVLGALAGRLEARQSAVEESVAPVLAAMAARAALPSATGSAVGPADADVFSASVCLAGAAALPEADALQLTDAERVRLDAAHATSAEAWRALLPAVREYVLFACT